MKEREIAVAPGAVHALPVDVEAWRPWSPHIVLPAPGDARARCGAHATGPLGRLVTLLVGPPSACGRRRRLARLARPAEFSDRRDSA